MWRILGNLLSTFATWTYSHPFWTLYRFRSNNRLKKLEDALVKTSATTRWHCLHLGSPQKERVKKTKIFCLHYFCISFTPAGKNQVCDWHTTINITDATTVIIINTRDAITSNNNITITETRNLWNIFIPKGGMELSFIVAIDFTASNGDPALVKIIRIHVFDDDY